MTRSETHIEVPTRFTLDNHLPEIGLQAMREEIMEGLNGKPRRIPSKYFYNKEGSALFEEITKLPEYYLSRTEKSILASLWHKMDIDAENLHLIELGSGDCSKIELLLKTLSENALKTIMYHPVDISSNALKESANQLMHRFPGLHIHGIVADFLNQVHVLPSERPRLFCFLGSTIGNFNKHQITGFMHALGKVMATGDHLLLGLDMIKEIDVLESAYNDKQGVTARFNKNILKVVNELVETNFDPGLFDHKSFYNKEKHRIEMHLVARKDMSVACGFDNSSLHLKAGETIHTENSHKFDRHQIHSMGEDAGLNIRQIFTDAAHWFSLVLYSKQTAIRKPSVV